MVDDVDDLFLWVSFDDIQKLLIGNKRSVYIFFAFDGYDLAIKWRYGA
jgi:hypothetical protein